jgi:hypothetical protein
LTDIEYQTFTTDPAQIHSNLPEGNKTVTINGDGSWGDTVYAVGSPDLLSRKKFNVAFPYNGITIERNGLNYHISGTATSRSTIYFANSDVDYNLEIDPKFIGKPFKLIVFNKG